MKQAPKMGKKQWAIILALSFCGALALSMQFKQPELPEFRRVNAFAEIFWNLQYSLVGTSTNSTPLFAGLAGLGVVNHRLRIKDRPVKLLLPICFLVALVWLMGAGFAVNNTLEALTASPGQVVKSVCHVLGSTYLLYQLGLVLFWWLEQRRPEKHLRPNMFVNLYQTHPFGLSVYLLILCWEPYVVAAYPGYMCYDAWNQLSQIFGTLPFTAHHPPAHTLFLGFFVNLGLRLGNANLGLYLSIVSQALITAAILAYALLMLKKWETPRWLRTASFLIMVLCPYYVTYVGLAIKDTLYSACFLLFMLETMCLLEDWAGCLAHWHHRLLLVLSALGTLLLRNNGKYVLYPTLAALLLYFGLAGQRRPSKKELAKIAALLIVPVVLASGFNAAVTARYGIEKGSIREALSLPFQQTARYVLERGDEVEEEEAAAISAVLDYEHLAEKYNPQISDPVKGTYKADATTGDLLRYLSVWFKQFWKHPEIYIQATVNQNYYLLYPFVENGAHYISTFPGNATWMVDKVNGMIGIHELEGLTDARVITTGFHRLMFSLPVIGILSNQATYNLLLVFLFLFSIHRKQWRWLMASVPIILSDIIVVLAPVIQGHPRYAFPIIYSMPVMVAYYIYLTSPAKSEKHR